jgi:hypothetical protein
MKDISAFLASLESKSKTGKVSGDMLATAKNVSSCVTSFITSHTIGTTQEEIGSFKINSAFDESAFESIGEDAILTLVRESGVPEAYVGSAAGSVAAILHRATKTRDFASAIAMQNKKSEANGTKSIISYEDLMPQSVHQFYVQPGLEVFGATSDKVISDLQVAITVSLLKWHNTITPRVLSNIPTTEPVVNYVREEVKVYNLGDTIDKDKSIIDLYSNPASITNELTKIAPLYANKVGSEILADGILAFGKEASLIALGVIANKVGFDKYNRTDIVADGVKLETVIVSIKVGSDTGLYTVSIPASRGRLTRVSNTISTVRAANITHTAVMTKDTAARATTTDTIDSIVGVTGDKLLVKLELSPRIDIRNGNITTLGSVSVSAVSEANGTADSATTTALGTATVTLYGYGVDARYAEENNRKSNIATTTERTQLSYEIPQGRNFVLDVPLHGPVVNATQNHANLHSIVRIGQDNVTLQMIAGVLASVGIAAEAYAANPVPENNPGALYAAGGRVRPTYVSSTLAMAGVDSFDDSRRQEAIQGRVMTHLGSVVQEIMAGSFLGQQLDGASAPTFRLITSPTILGNIVGAKPGEYQGDSANGVELTLKLTSGAILECVTTTFADFSDKIIIIPFLAGNPASDLNFGHNRDFGTIVGSYTHSDNNSAVQRLLANVRELPVPTNAVGAIIDVTGIDAATLRA